MKLLSIALLLTMTTWVSGQEKPEPTPLDGKIEWVFDYDQGKQLSQETGKPIFLVFRCER